MNTLGAVVSALVAALEAAGRPAEAIPHLRAVLAIQSDFAPAHALLGRLLVTVELASVGWPEDVTEVGVETLDGRMLVQSHDVSAPAGDYDLLQQALQTKFLSLASPCIGPERALDLMARIQGLAGQEPLK